MLLGEQPLGERLVVEPGRGDPGEGIEGAARLERLEAKCVEAVDEQAPATVVLGDHPHDVRLALEDGRERGVLGRRAGPT